MNVLHAGMDSTTVVRDEIVSCLIRLSTDSKLICKNLDNQFIVFCHF